MKDFKIVGWTYFDAPYKTRKFSGDELNDVINMLCDEIAGHNYVFSGEEHQNSLTGMPVFSDGTCFRASMRAWGNIMANVYSGPNGEKLTYMDFYMSLGDSANMPEYAQIDVPPAEVEDESSGAMLKEDKELIDQSLAMDMVLMTTDKVLKKIYNKIKDGKK